MIYKPKKVALRMKKIYLTLILSNMGLLACQEPQKQATQEAKKDTVAAKIQPDEKKEIKLLVGKWQAMDDPRNFVEFTENATFREINGNDVLLDSPYIFDKACKDFGKEAQSQQKKVGCFSVKDKEEVFKYLILTLTADKLDYTMLGGRGNVLAYKKVTDEKK